MSVRLFDPPPGYAPQYTGVALTSLGRSPVLVVLWDDGSARENFVVGADGSVFVSSSTGPLHWTCA
jgi:hypothetical protein